MSKTIIQLEGVHKYYGRVHALRGLNLEVRRGEVFGFLGPNGAGKTTTIRCMLDLVRPTQGRINILGVDPQKNPQAVKAQVGYLPGSLKLAGDFTVRDFLRFIQRLRRTDKDWSTAAALAERLDLRLNLKIKTLSQGNKQKVGLIQALMCPCPLLMLDEPTLGLDPLMKQEILNLIQEKKEKGTTVFFSSHILSEVQAVADRVGMIRKGELVEIAETNTLIDRALTRATVHFKEAVTHLDLSDLPEVAILRRSESGQVVTLEITGDMDAFIKKLAHYPVQDLAIHRPTLEELFMKYYQGEAKPGAEEK